MQVFYKDGFYIKGINMNIPTGAVEISEETYKLLLKDLKNGKIISTDENGYPISSDNLELIKERELKEVQEEFEKTINKPIFYNGFKYLPKNLNIYVGLLPRFYTENTTMEIWNEDGYSDTFNKQDMIELIKSLEEVYENAYQAKKAKEKMIKG